MIKNPILTGFHPDPSICRAGDDYYIANSTFEWFPGVRLHHSKDLLNWAPVGHALTRVSQLDMVGNPDSGGIWAPALSHADGQFWLVYTDVKWLKGPYKDTPNYLVTASSIEGPWSDPVYLHSSGFDPSLFHDDDGRKWLVSMRWDHRPKSFSPFNGILLQEYCPKQQRLIGPIERIFIKAEGITEGPHLYKRDGWYYLVTAEGGTSYAHCVTIARSRSITGPYEVDPQNPVLSSKHDRSLPLQKSGHGSWIETPQGEVYMVHLCSRPLPGTSMCPLGRETALQKCEWTDDGWLRPVGGRSPALEVAEASLPECPVADKDLAVQYFNDGELGTHWQTLRVPFEESWGSFINRPEVLRLLGRESLTSCHRQSLVARRVQHFHGTYETEVDFSPEDFQQMAGLSLFYNTGNWAYVYITHSEEHGRILQVSRCRELIHYSEHCDTGIPLPPTGKVQLRLRIDMADARFSYRTGDSEWQEVGPVFDTGEFSDDFVSRNGNWGFTGAMVALCVQDLSGRRIPADFSWFARRDLK